MNLFLERATLMSRREQKRRQELRVEPLERRALLSGLGTVRPRGDEAAILARLEGPKLSFNSAGSRRSSTHSWAARGTSSWPWP